MENQGQSVQHMIKPFVRFVRRKAAFILARQKHITPEIQAHSRDGHEPQESETFLDMALTRLLNLLVETHAQDTAQSSHADRIFLERGPLHPNQARPEIQINLPDGSLNINEIPQRPHVARPEIEFQIIH